MIDWMEKPFVDYLNAVDAELETRYGKTTLQSDLDSVAWDQESGVTPLACAKSVAKRHKYREIRKKRSKRRTNNE